MKLSPSKIYNHAPFRWPDGTLMVGGLNIWSFVPIRGGKYMKNPVSGFVVPVSEENVDEFIEVFDKARVRLMTKEELKNKCFDRSDYYIEGEDFLLEKGQKRAFVKRSAKYIVRTADAINMAEERIDDIDRKIEKLKAEKQLLRDTILKGRASDKSNKV